MTLRFIDGVGHYTLATATGKYTTIGGAASVGAHPSGGNAWQFFTGTTNYVGIVLPASASWVIGFKFRFTGVITSNPVIARLMLAGAQQVELRLRASGVLAVVRNGTNLTGGDSTEVFSPDVDYYVEWKVTIANSIGASSCLVRINGTNEVINVTTGQDTQAQASASADEVRFGTASSTNTVQMYIKDIYICDQSGSANNDFLGHCVVDLGTVDSDGTYSNFTPSTGTDHFALVDDATPNTTDYVDSDTVGDRDSYGIAPIRALVDDTIFGVQVCAALNKDDAGARSASTFVRSVTTNGDGTGVALSTSQTILAQVYEQDPATAAAWTQSGVNAMEIGVRVTA